MTEQQKRAVGLAALVVFAGSVVLANWLVTRYGVVRLGFGLTGPAGVYAAGIAFGLRDVVHETLGRLAVVVGILAGAVLSWLVGSGDKLPGGVVALAVASAVAFMLSEAADFAVYEPLRERTWPGAVVASNAAGALVDSAVFLWLAFGSTAHLWGQAVGKWYMILPALPLVWLTRRALSRHRLRPASP